MLPARPFLGDEVAEHVRDQILSGDYPPGAFIRVEKLAAELGVSPTPVREALVGLREQGFVELVPRRGFRVQALKASDVADIFGVMEYIDGELAARAAEALTDDAIGRLAMLHDELAGVPLGTDVAEIKRLDYAFHHLINDHAGSPKLALIEEIAYRYVPHGYIGGVGYRSLSNAGHARIVDAITARNPGLARDVMRAHIREMGDLVRELTAAAEL